MLDNFQIFLAPTAEQARDLDPDITVEAEYGDDCVEGKEITLAHHGSRSDNPAPCNTEVEPLERGTIVLSHIDLDAVGGSWQPQETSWKTGTSGQAQSILM